MTNGDDHSGAAVGGFRDTLTAERFSGVVAATSGGRPGFEWSHPAAAAEVRRPNRVESRFATRSVSKFHRGLPGPAGGAAALWPVDHPLVEVVSVDWCGLLNRPILGNRCDVL